MQEKWLPGNTMDRIRDMCKRRNITQVELAQAIGMDRSTLSRVMSEKTSKLSSQNLVAIANYFEVSTDFLLGLTDIPSRNNHDIEQLGLSVEAAVNLYQGKVNRSVVCQLLENQKFADLTRQIALYQEGGSRLRRCCAEPDVQFYEQSDAGTRADESRGYACRSRSCPRDTGAQASYLCG